jgi:hypothetical protein
MSLILFANNYLLLFVVKYFLLCKLFACKNRLMVFSDGIYESVWIEQQQKVIKICQHKNLVTNLHNCSRQGSIKCDCTLECHREAAVGNQPRMQVPDIFKQYEASCEQACNSLTSSSPKNWTNEPALKEVVYRVTGASRIPHHSPAFSSDNELKFTQNSRIIQLTCLHNISDES